MKRSSAQEKGSSYIGNTMVPYTPIFQLVSVVVFMFLNKTVGVFKICFSLSFSPLFGEDTHPVDLF